MWPATWPWTSTMTGVLVLTGAPSLVLVAFFQKHVEPGALCLRACSDWSITNWLQHSNVSC